MYRNEDCSTTRGLVLEINKLPLRVSGHRSSHRASACRPCDGWTWVALLTARGICHAIEHTPRLSRMRISQIVISRAGNFALFKFVCTVQYCMYVLYCMYCTYSTYVYEMSYFEVTISPRNHTACRQRGKAKVFSTTERVFALAVPPSHTRWWNYGLTAY